MPYALKPKVEEELRRLQNEGILTKVEWSNLDPMPTKLVVESLDHLLPAITKMINSSLLGGHFPKVWKEALIDPRYKKSWN